MRRLLLLRHAKAERAEPGGRDHDRVLADRGRTDAARLGAYLARHGFVPDRALVSTATRTRETWTLLATAFTTVPPVTFDERLYDAAPPNILQVIQETTSAAGTLLVVGHNPAMHETATMLLASGDIDARQRLREEFPTTALAVIQFATEDWRGVHVHGGRLERFVTPQSLAEND